MPISSSASVDYADPASVNVYVADVIVSDKSIESPTYVDVHVVVDPRFASGLGQMHDPTPTLVTASTVSWVHFSLADYDQFSARLAHQSSSEVSCATVTVNVNSANDDNQTHTPVVCYP